MIKRGALVALLATGLALSACGGDDDDTSTPTAASDGLVAVTFKVDVSTKADGTNELAKVEAGESVYIVGDFEGGCDYNNDPDNLCWKPQSANRVMTDDGGGIWSITIRLAPGTTLAYKYVKTSDDANDGWANGVKDYKTTDDAACLVVDTDSDGIGDANPESGAGLWEITNLSYTVGDADATVDTYTVEAWRDYAEGFGYPSCD